MSDGEGDSATGESPTCVCSNDLLGIQPPTFDWQVTNLPHAFKGFKRYCEIILSTPTYARKKGPEVVNYILLWIGPQAVEIFDNWTHLSDAQRACPADVWEAFTNFFEPKSNFRLARFQLRELVQRPDEPIDSYVNRLKVQAQRCNFDGTNLEDNLIDQVIKGTVHIAVRKKLLDQDPKTLTLDKAIDLTRTYEATQSQLQQLGQVNRSVDALKAPSNVAASHITAVPRKSIVSSAVANPTAVVTVPRMTTSAVHVQKLATGPRFARPLSAGSRGPVTKRGCQTVRPVKHSGSKYSKPQHGPPPSPQPTC